MGQIDQNILKRFAAKYVWWKAPDEAIRQPERVVAGQVEGQVLKSSFFSA